MYDKSSNSNASTFVDKDKERGSTNWYLLKVKLFQIYDTDQ